ncbi:MAG: hypothetical protein AMXMBFR19_04770 [Chthonomonadaceae bacterium]
MWLVVIERPDILVFGCAIWVPLAVWIISLVHWMVTAEIDFVQGLVGIVVAGALGFLTVNPPHPSLPPLFVLAAVATIALAPVVRVAINRSEMGSIEVEAIDRAYEQLAHKPDNLGAKFRLAKALYNKGIRAHAIEIAREALQGAPERLFTEELRMLEKWQEAERREPTARRIRCVECGIPNFPGSMYCTTCGAPYLLDYAQGRWVKAGLVRRVTWAWLAAMFAVVGIPTAALTLPLVAAVITIGLLLALAIWTFLSAMKEPVVRPS